MARMGFRLGECIRIGRSAEVFRGTLPDGQAITIKRFFAGHEPKRESDLAAKLDHPNLVALLGAEHDETNRLCMVYEWVDGIDAGSWLRQGGRVPLGAAVYIAREILGALAYLHDHAGILHRDVTPSNVLLGWDGTVKLTDFGIAKPLASAVTSGALLRGTPGYLSPEQLDGDELDERSDLFSLGALFYELVTGRNPFGETPHEALAGLLEYSAVVPARSLRPELDATLSGLIDKLLAPIHSDRWRSAREVLAAMPVCPAGRAELAAAMRCCVVCDHASGVADWQPGDTLPAESVVTSLPMSRYELEELIGYGGMAEVWRGWRLVADGSRERVAIKRILPCHAREPEAVARFDREARLARAVRHEHIVKAVDYVPEGDERWLVMEHLEGLSLRELRERVGRLPHELLRGIANHVLDALRYLHGRSILHRDISPSNIMLTRSGEVLLLDLGLFKDLTSGTHSVVFKGTPAYASWEALRGEELAPSSDLYSVAAVFFELLVGELPYGQGPPDRVALYQFSSNPFEKLPDDVPDDFRVLFEGLLTRRETRSFHGAQEVLTVMAYFGEKYEVAEAPEIAAVVEEAMAAQPPVAAVALAKGSGPRRTERMSPSAMAPQQGIAVAVEPPGDEPQAESEAAAVAVLADKQLSSMASTPISDRPWLHRMAAVAALVLFVAGIGLWYGVHQGEAVAIDFFAEQEGQP